MRTVLYRKWACLYMYKKVNEDMQYIHVVLMINIYRDFIYNHFISLCSINKVNPKYFKTKISLVMYPRIFGQKQVLGNKLS